MRQASSNGKPRATVLRTALAMSKVAADKKKPIIVVGAGAPALTNEQCTPYTLNYAYDTVAQAASAQANRPATM